MEKTVKNPTNNLVKVNSKNNKQIVTKTVTKNKVNNTKNIKENQKTTTQTKNSNKTNTTNDKETKQITKNTIKNTKQATATATDYATLKSILTTSTDEKLTVTLDEGTYTDDGQITVNSAIKNLTIDGNGQTINGNSKAFLKVTNLNLTIKNITITGCKANNGPVLYQTGGETTIVNSTISHNSLTEDHVGSNLHGVIKLESGILTLDNNTIEGNSIYYRLGFIVSTTQTSKIVNNKFIDNTCNDFYSADIKNSAGLINILVNEIHDNEYIGNKLSVYVDFSEDLGISVHDELDVYDDICIPVIIRFNREVYNTTVHNGNVRLWYGMNNTGIDFPVEDGVTFATLSYDDIYYNSPEYASPRRTSGDFVYSSPDNSYGTETSGIDLLPGSVNSPSLSASVNPTRSPLGETFTINGTLKAGSKVMIANYVKLSINGEYVTTGYTNGNGQVFFEYTPSVIGEYTATLTVERHGGIKNAASKTVSFTATGTPTQISLDLDQSTVTVDDVVKVTGILINNDTKEPIAGATINLTFNNSYVASNTTDSNGYYEFYYVTNVSSTANNNLKVSFGTDVERNFDACSNSTKLTVNKALTYIVITATNVTQGEPVTISGYVYNANTGQVISHTGTNLIRIRTSDVNSNKDVALNNGYFTYTYTPTKTGEMSVNVTYNRNNAGSYNQSKNTTKYTVAAKTNMTVNNEKAIIVGQNVNIHGVLTVQGTTTTIKNTKVNITVGDTL